MAVTDNGWEWRIVGANPAGFDRTVWHGGNPRFVAIIGANWQFSEESGQWPTTPLATNADSLRIYTVNLPAGSGTIVGVSRSTYVESPFGHVRVAKTMENRNPANTVETLKMETGLPIEGYVHTGMGSIIGGGNPPPGFTDLVDAYGGFPFFVPYGAPPASEGDTFVDRLGALQVARERITLPHGGPDRTLASGFS